MAATWKTIAECPLYQVSNTGYVRALFDGGGSTQRKYKAGRILVFKWAGRKREYKQVCLIHNGKRHYRYIHRLVAQAFIPNPLNLPTVNHKHGQFKDNNHVGNLEWATFSRQTTHAIGQGLIQRAPSTGQFVHVKGVFHVSVSDSAN